MDYDLERKYDLERVGGSDEQTLKWSLSNRPTSKSFTSANLIAPKCCAFGLCSPGSELYNGDSTLLSDRNSSPEPLRAAAADDSANVAAAASEEGPTMRSLLMYAASLLPILICIVIDLPGFDNDRPAQRCLGLLLYASFLWATNPIPAHITALSIPLLAVLLQVCCVPRELDSSALLPWSIDIHTNSTAGGRIYKPGDVLGAKESSSMLSSSMFDPVILLFLGGFSIAAALDRYNISSRIASKLLSSAGTRPSRVLLALLLMGLVFSGFMSNVAAAVLISSIITPMVHKLSLQTEWPQMALLGVAFSCNIGGMVTPIASPQNLIAVLAIHDAGGSVSFVEWTGFALPSCLCILAVSWILLRVMFKTRLPDGIEFTQDADPPPVTANEIFVGIVVGGTIMLWILFDPLKTTFGNIGIIALIPVVILFGFGFLTKQDFDNLPWNVIILMGGGLALGTAVETSGLLEKIANGVETALEGQSLWVVMFTFNCIMAVTANFISSTVSAIIFLPLIAKVGASIGHVNALTVTACMMTSGAMGLPVSSFPNANTYSIRRKDGRNFITNIDLVKCGFTMTGVVLVVIHSVGYLTVIAFGW